MKTSSGREARPCTEPSKCKRCKADILWCVWPKSQKRMPVDAVPDMRPAVKAESIVLTLVGGEFGELQAEKFYEPKHGDKRNRYTSHMATCGRRE